MLKNINIVFISLTFLLCFVLYSCKQEKIPDYPVKTNNFKKVTTYKELTTFLKQINKASDIINVEYRGTTSAGYEMPVVYVQSSEESSISKIDILILAQQHGDEPSGKEAVLALLSEIAQQGVPGYLKKLNLIIFPQVNPWGGDNDKRRNSNDFDLNRDHLVLATPENQIVHSVFQGHRPHVTVDIHEFDPYYKKWKDFGYYKNADIQLGGPTNPNIDSNLIAMFENEILPFVQEKVENSGYKFLEYTIGQIYNDKGRLRHSTTHIDDGRQSFGIMHSLSLIIEGKYGQNSVENLKNRTLSQLVTIKAIIDYCHSNANRIKQNVEKARKNLQDTREGQNIGVRFAHIQNGETLAYPLWSIEQKKDTVFMVEEYYPVRKSILEISRPGAYLFDKSDQKLINWLNRSGIELKNYIPEKGDRIMQYKIVNYKDTLCNEGWSYIDVDTETEELNINKDNNNLIMVTLDQIASNKISLSLEPQSMLALHNDTAFNYLLKTGVYPVYRLITKE